MAKSTPIETRRGFVETAGLPAAASFPAEATAVLFGAAGTTVTAGAFVPSGGAS
jgi:hypothetical protein